MKLTSGKKYYYLTRLQDGLDNSLEQVLSKNTWAELTLYIDHLKNDLKEEKDWNALTVVALTWQLEKLSTKNGITKQNPTLIDVGYVSLVVIDLLQENIQSLILLPLANKVILIW